MDTEAFYNLHHSPWGFEAYCQKIVDICSSRVDEYQLFQLHDIFYVPLGPSFGLLWGALSAGIIIFGLKICQL